MSELSATNCGCGCENGGISNGNNSCLWIILLLCCCGGFGGGCNGGGCGCGDNFGGNNSCLCNDPVFAAAVDADSDSPLSKNSPVHILHRGVFSFPYLRQIHSPLIFQRTFLSLLTLHALFFQYFLFPDLMFQHTMFINLIHCISVDDQFSLHDPYTPVFLFSTIICRDSVLSLSSYFISTPHIYRMWDMIAKIGSVFMEKKPTKPMTPFDEVTIPFELTLLKLILPYTSAAKEQTVWILIKLMELKNTIRFFKHPEHIQTTLGLTAQSLPQSPTEILDILTPYLSPEQTQTIEQFQNVMNMMEIVPNVPSRNRFRYHRLSVAGSGESRFKSFRNFQSCRSYDEYALR